MIDLTPIPNRLTRPNTLDDDADSFFGKLPQWAADLLALQSTFGTISSGNACKIPYKMDLGTTMADPTAGWLRLNSATQNAATALVVDTIGSDAIDYTSMLYTFDDSTSAVLGFIRLEKQGDSSKFLIFSVTAMTTPAGYRQFTVSCVGYSSANPFAQGDVLVMSFTRTGDKGDTGDPGAAYTPQSAKFSDRKATSTAGGTSTGNSTAQVRTLNTTDQNTIPSGVSLASNRVTLPAGTYDVRGRAPAYSVGAHRAFLWNVTSGAVALLGISAYSGSGGAWAESTFRGRIVLAASAQFEIRHFTSIGTNSNDLGVPAGVSGQVEIYTEVEFIKVA